MTAVRIAATSLLLAAGLRAQIEVRMPVERFCRVALVSGAALSDDGNEIAYTSDESGVPNVYRVGADGEGRRALTDSSTGAIDLVAILPREPRRYLVRADRGGDERPHLYVLDSRGGMQDLTPREGLCARFFGFGADETTLFIATNERDPGRFDLYAYRDARGAGDADGDPFPREIVFRNDAGFDIAGIGPDGRRLILSRSRGTRDSDLHLVELGGKAAPRLLTAHKLERTHRFLALSPQGVLHMASGGEGDFDSHVTLDLQSGRMRTAPRGYGDILEVVISRTGRYRGMLFRERGRSLLQVWDEDRAVEVPEAGDGIPVGVRFAAFGSRALLLAESDQSPLALHAWDVATGSTTPLTHPFPGDLDPAALVGGVPGTFASFDGAEIPGLLYRPIAARREQPAPALVFAGDGPGGEVRPRFDATIQTLVNHGFAVFAVNVRGSAGYGRKHRELGERRQGQDDVRDLVLARAYLAGLPFIDAKRIGLLGEGYGGFLALLAAREPGFRGVAVLNPILDLDRFVAACPPWIAPGPAALLAVLGDGPEDRARRRQHAPSAQAAKVQVPVLLIRAENAVHTPADQAEEFRDRVRAAGGTVQELVLPAEGRHIRRRESRIRAVQAILDFALAHLRGG